MSGFLSDLGKSLLAKRASTQNTGSATQASMFQTRCPECEYSSEAYDVDEYCSDCDGQSNFQPREGQLKPDESSAYEQILDLVSELTDEQKRELIKTLEESLAEQEDRAAEPSEELDSGD